MVLKHKAAVAAMAALMSVAGTAQAAFEGRDATGAASDSCTATGLGKCTYFYDNTLDVTILNNWNIGRGIWSASAEVGSAQALAASAGLTASGLTGWVLPTGDGGAGAGAQNQYRSIWSSVGSTFGGLSAQFDDVQPTFYWSGTSYPPEPLRSAAWIFYADGGFQFDFGQDARWYTVAVRPGDVAAVPEPETGAMMLVALAAFAMVVRRRPR